MDRITVIHVTFVGLLACGGGSGGDEIAVEQLGEELGGATCERMFECCTAEELMAELGIADVETVEECTSFFAAFVGGFFVPQIQAAIDSGRLVYRGDRMAECVESLRAMPCDELAEAMTDELPVVGCDDPFEGQVADGDPCANDVECQSDTCVGESIDFEGNVTEGVCGAPPGGGDACDLGECGPGLYCDFGPDGETCQAQLSPGSECSSDDQCTTESCTGGDPESGVPGTCSAEYTCDGM